MAIVEPIASAGPRRRLRLRSPVTLEPIGEIECASAEDVRAAVERARKAQPAWAELSFEERAACMQRVSARLLERTDAVLDQVVEETGKARNEALFMEVLASLDSLAYYAKNARRFLGPERRRIHGLLGFAKQLRVVYRPLGVIGIITPWNGPFVLAMNQSVQALMAGNTAVVKGSEVTPASTRLVQDFFDEAGLPDGVLQVLVGDGETGAALVESDVDKISFTGSVATGRRVAEACGRRLIPASLELGGKDAMIVCADANLERAASGALMGACMNSGHVCTAVERIYAVEEIYDAFVAKVVEGASKLRQGASGEFDVGAIFWDRQLATIERHVEDARAKGARIWVGGRRNPNLPGLFYEPTVMTDVHHGMEIMRDETFGPILCIQKVRDEEEAIRLANDSRYGLSGSVWSRDKKRACEIAQRLETGSVCVNDPALIYGVPEAPFGGRKESGIGQVNGAKGLRGYCHELPILIDRFGGRQVQGGYPYRLQALEGIKRFLKIFFGTPLGRWLS
jgi:succinate-semialdehyde dehydrogenase/glutarate-semialdehyde dehydrogenase